jgi:hypothetical protein
MSMSNSISSAAIAPHRPLLGRHRRIAAALAVAVLAGGACDGASEGGGSPAHGPAPAAPTSSTPGLAITVNTSAVVSGALTRNGTQLQFIFERTPEGHRLSFADAAGASLLRATVTSTSESVLVPDAAVKGPRGSLLGSAPGAWDAVTVTGNPAALSSALRGPELSLLGELSHALQQRPDIDASVFPELAAFDPKLAGAPLPTRDGLLASHDPVGCAVCHGTCAALTAGCIAASWGIGAIFCGIAGIACHAGCAGSACQ